MGKILSLREHNGEGLKRQWCAGKNCDERTPWAQEEAIEETAVAAGWTRLCEAMPSVLLCPKHSTQEDRLAFYRSDDVDVVNIRQLGARGRDRYRCAMASCDQFSPYAPTADAYAVARLAGWVLWNGMIYCPNHTFGQVQESARWAEVQRIKAAADNNVRIDRELRQYTEKRAALPTVAIPAIPGRRKLRGAATGRG